MIELTNTIKNPAIIENPGLEEKTEIIKKSILQVFECTKNLTVLYKRERQLWSEYLSNFNIYTLQKWIEVRNLIREDLNDLKANIYLINKNKNE